MRVRTGHVAILLLVVISTSAAQPDLERDRFSGVFAVSGPAREGRTYSGELHIEKNGQAYTVRWKLDSGEDYAGVGIATGETLSVGWIVVEAAGVAMSDFSKTPIVGRWATVGDERMCEETITPKR